MPLNVGDDEGLTPLHLSVISGNSRIVRILLDKGADRDVKDNKHKKPIELALDNENWSVVKVLEGSSGGGWTCSILPTNKPQRKKKRLLLFFMIMYSFGIVLHLVFHIEVLCPPMLYTFCITIPLAYTMFLIVCILDPGYLPR